MTTMLMRLLIIIFLLISAHFSFANRVGETRYAAGGITGTFIGLGLGHAIQGRWISDDAYIITLIEIASASAIVTAKPITTCVGSAPALSCSITYPDYVSAAAILLLGTRIYEIFDVWSTSPNMSVGLIPQPEYPKLFLTYKF